MNVFISNTELISRVLMVLSLTLFGVVAGKTGTIKEEVRQPLADLIMNFTLPPLVFVSITTDLSWEQITAGILSPMLALGLVLITILVVVALGRLLRLPAHQVGTISLLCAMPNSGFIGFPVILAVFGREGLAFAVLYDLGYTVAFCTLAILMLTGLSGLKESWKMLINPVLIAMVAGLVINRLGITIPEVVLTPLQIMGNATIPLAMLLMGYLLGGINIRASGFGLTVGLICLGKLIVYPLLAYFFVSPLNLPPIARAVVLIEAAMPSMASTPVLTQKYGGNTELAVATVFITTLLSLITLPLMVYLLV